MKTITEEWPATRKSGILSNSPSIKFYAKEINRGRRRSRPHTIYLMMNDNPPVDYSEVELFAHLISRDGTAG